MKSLLGRKCTDENGKYTSIIDKTAQEKAKGGKKSLDQSSRDRPGSALWKKLPNENFKN